MRKLARMTANTVMLVTLLFAGCGGGGDSTSNPQVDKITVTSELSGNQDI